MYSLRASAARIGSRAYEHSTVTPDAWSLLHSARDPPKDELGGVGRADA